LLSCRGGGGSGEEDGGAAVDDSCCCCCVVELKVDGSYTFEQWLIGRPAGGTEDDDDDGLLRVSVTRATGWVWSVKPEASTPLALKCGSAVTSSAALPAAAASGAVDAVTALLLQEGYAAADAQGGGGGGGGSGGTKEAAVVAGTGESVRRVQQYLSVAFGPGGEYGAEFSSSYREGDDGCWEAGAEGGVWAQMLRV
jgi:hypothetical protein